MIINKDCSLILSNLYYYDIPMCYYNILKSIGWDLSNIDPINKEERNIKIGILQKNNKELSRYLINSTDNIINSYLKFNKIDTNTELIVRQRDGIIVTRKLDCNTITIPLEYRSFILRIVIDSNRIKFLTIYENGEVETKGIRDKPEDSSFYAMFNNISFSNYRSIIDSIESMRRSIFTSDNIYWFSIPCEEGYLVPIKKYGMIKLKKSTLTVVDMEDIDRNYIWRNYIWDFCNSILLTYN